MGNTQFKKDKCGANLRQAITRMNIHRQKRLNKIAKQKDDICNHLNAQNEVNAKIWAETLINDENQIPCYDIACTMCDQIRGRLDYMAKFGPPKDMHQTFATVIHLAPKLGVEELEVVRKQLVKLLGDEFAMQADEDKTMLNPVVAQNIDFMKPEDGQVIFRLRQLAKERNIAYQPSYDMQIALNSYIDRKGLIDPMDNGQGGGQQMMAQIPQYNPQQPPNMPPGMPPGGGNGGGGGQMYMPPPQQPGVQVHVQIQDPNAMPPGMQPGGMMPPPNMPPNMPPVYQPQMGMGMGGPPMQPPPVMGVLPDPNPGPQQPMPPAPGPPPQTMGGGGNQPPPGGPPPAAPPGGGAGEMDDLEARLNALQGL